MLNLRVNQAELVTLRLEWEVLKLTAVAVETHQLALLAEYRSKLIQNLSACELPLCAVLKIPSLVNVEFSGKFTYAGLSEGVRVADWAAVFDKVTGALTSYKIDGTELLKEALMPSFGRAPVENDLGAKLHVKSEVWRYPVFELLSFNVEKKADRYVVTTLYEIPVGQVSMTYDIFSDGSLSVSEKMIDTGELSKAPDLFRYGMKFAMPGDFSTMDFYGLGPWDNYCDRNSSALLGHYTQRVEDQYWYGI